MLRYVNFEQSVMAEAGSMAEEWKHLLPAIPIAHRNRFLDTIRKGFSIPESFDMIVLSQTLIDRDYDAFTQQALAKKLARQVPDSGQPAATAGI